MTDLEDRQQAEIYSLHAQVARLGEQISRHILDERALKTEVARLTLERDAHVRHASQLLAELHASEARRQKAELQLKARETASA